MTLRADAFFGYLNERERVRLRKEADLSFPWTEDDILRTYKFTNAHRHHDKTSRLLREEFYGPNFQDDRRTILMHCAMFRYFGTIEMAREIGWTSFEEMTTDYWDAIKDLAEFRLEEGKKVFTGAYVITNQGISAPKYEVVVDYFLKDLQAATQELMLIVAKTQSWEEVSKRMKKIGGFGGTGFMTKEVLLDTTYTGFWDDVRESPKDGTFSYPVDWWTWTPIGPGALRGAGRLLDEDFDVKTKVRETTASDVIDQLMDQQDLFWEGENRLAPTDIQFALCEFDKYERVRLGQGKPRSKYRHV